MIYCKSVAKLRRKFVVCGKISCVFLEGGVFTGLKSRDLTDLTCEKCYVLRIFFYLSYSVTSRVFGNH
jgi:hypothetical protein